MLLGDELRYSPASIPLKTFYCPEDVASLNYDQDVGNPGGYPFTRGLYPQGYRRYAWVQRNICGFDLPEDTNRRLKQLLEAGQQSYGGQPAANIAFDLPTQRGYDSDHPLARLEAGKTGTICNTVLDMALLFQDIALDNFNVGLNLNSLAPVNVAMYIVNAENQGVPMVKLRGQNPSNPLGYYNGCQIIFPPRVHFRMMVDLVKFCTRQMPLWGTINLFGYGVSEGGGTAVQEIAFPLAQAIELTGACIEEGLAVDEFIPRFSSFVGLGDNFFENIAKIRAFRRMWARVMRERFGAGNKACSLRIMTWTAGSSATARQPLNNIARVAIEALSGILAGVQMIHTTAYDEALLVPSEEAAWVAMMTQKIIEYETGVIDVADPLGGSYFLESLTTRMEEEAWKQVRKIEELGGHLACFEQGYFEREIAKEALKKQRQIDNGEQVVIGVNKYVKSEEEPVRIFEHNPQTLEIATKRLKEWRLNRDAGLLREALEKVKEVVLEKEELMPCLIEAVRAKATLGEIAEVLRESWGEYQHPAFMAR